jgi:hypothetical protein
MRNGTTDEAGTVQGSLNRSFNSGTAARLCLRFVAALCVPILLAVSASGGPLGQRTKRAPQKAPQKHEPTLSARVAKAKADVVAAANDYKASLARLLVLQEQDVTMAQETVEKRKELLALAIISKKELEESERALAGAQGKVANTKREIGESDNLIAEATAEKQLTNLAPGAYQTTAALIRYNGPAHWVLTDAAKVQSFFALRFNHALPISAFGQTKVHDQLGFDHHNSIDVAVSPDSAEGQTLMSYLRSAGIPFIAFRYAVAGSATGAHIHIGYPSKRVGK